EDAGGGGQTNLPRRRPRTDRFEHGASSEGGFRGSGDRTARPEGLSLYTAKRANLSIGTRQPPLRDSFLRADLLWQKEYQTGPAPTIITDTNVGQAAEPAVACKQARRPAPHEEKRMTATYKQLTDFLLQLGTDQVGHSEKSYLAHLIGV